MYGFSRGLSILVCAFVAGLLVWMTTRVDSVTMGGYWIAVGLVAAAGLVFALVQLVGRVGETRPTFSPESFLVGFLPVLIVSGWIIVAGTPRSSFGRHVLSWSQSLHIRPFVVDMTSFWPLLVFATALALVYSFSGYPRPVVIVEEVAEPAVAPAAVAEEPVAAEPVVTTPAPVAAPDAELEPVTSRTRRVGSRA